MDLQETYNAIANIRDRHTRNLLYRQFIEKFFPEAVRAILTPDAIDDDSKCPNTASGKHHWQDPTKNTVVACHACGKIAE